jgi:hypothetical protein
VGERDNEPTIFVDLFWRRLPLQQSGRVTEVLQPVLPELFQRVVVRVIPLRFRRDDVIE